MSELEMTRTCANCACSIMRKHPVLVNEERMFCARNTVMSHIMRVGKPRIDPISKEVMNDKRTGKPIMESVDDLVFVYAPTLAELTCYDGWRPIGTLPGDKWQNASVDQLMDGLMKNYQRLLDDVASCER